MAARQEHGLEFEDWVRKTFTRNKEGPKTAEWDIEKPDYKGEYSEHTSLYSGLPVSIKVRRRGQPIQFADVLRQYYVKKDFLLIVGIWEAGKVGKRITDVSVARVVRQEWKKLFAEVAPPDGSKESTLTASKMGGKIEAFVDFVKDKKLSVDEARQEAAIFKRGIPKMTMTMNQKIGDDQRRVQCSLRFSIFMLRFAALQPHIKVGKVIRATLWGVPVPDLK